MSPPVSFLSVLVAVAILSPLSQPDAATRDNGALPSAPTAQPDAAARSALAAGTAARTSPRPMTTARAPRFERVYPLSPNEGVFAYSRISPDGNVLAYASETRGGRQRTIRVVDLRTREVVFTEPGIDAYWSTDGTRMIWLSQAGGSNVSVRHHDTGEISRRIAPVALGDYYSWGVRDGRDLILTIIGRYYFLDGDRGEMPAGSVEPCDGIGRGERPLLSREGDRITTFVRGNIVVRNLIGCDFVLDTGIRGAKADFAWGGRYIAFHSPKETGSGYDIRVVDVEEKTVRTITNFPGSSYFPSWTRDGRLSFRYDGEDYRGFMMASDVLSALARPLPHAPAELPAERQWDDIFPETERPASRLSLVMVWGPWSAHSPDALADLDRAREYFMRESIDIGVLHATDPGSFPGDAERLLERERVGTARIPLAPERLPLTEAHNQNPTTLLFRDGVLVDRRMGALTSAQLREWAVSYE
jgi:hypothetical protein